MVLLSLWVGISSLPRLAAGGRGGRGSAGRREGLGLPSLSGSRGRPPRRPTRLARGAEQARGRFAAKPEPRRSSLRPAQHASRRSPSHHARSQGRIPRQGGLRSRGAPALSFLRGGEEASRGNGTHKPTTRRSEMEISLDIHISNCKLWPLNGKISIKQPTEHPCSRLLPLFFYLVSSQLARHASGNVFAARDSGICGPGGILGRVP